MTLRGMYDNVPWWRQILSLLMIVIYSAAYFVFKLFKCLVSGRLWHKLFKIGDK